MNQANRLDAVRALTDLMFLKFELAAVKVAISIKRHDVAHHTKFDPEQPRVPAGSPRGGQWVASHDDELPGGTVFETFAAARRSGRSWKYCAVQYAVDGLLCNSIEPASTRASCWRQAAERLGACLSGRSIPPLIY